MTIEIFTFIIGFIAGGSTYCIYIHWARKTTYYTSGTCCTRPTQPTYVNYTFPKNVGTRAKSNLYKFSRRSRK